MSPVMTDVKTIQRAEATILDYSGNRWTRRDDRLQNTHLPDVCFIFLEDGALFKKCKDEDRMPILSPFQVPEFLSSQMCTDLNGFFGSESSFTSGPDENLICLKTWFRCLVKVVLGPDDQRPPDGKDYRWYEMGIFTIWEQKPDETGHTCKVLCIDTPPKLRTALLEVLQKSSPPKLADPFAFFGPLFDQIVYLYDESIWRVRDQVRAFEKSRGKDSPDFTAMHEIFRHANQIIELEAATINTMESLLQRQETVHEILKSSLNKTYREQAQEHLKFQLQIMNNCKLRSMSIHDRMRAEISLAYNMIANQDNMVMKSIALLTMVFLPATFVSALFSTTFFSYDDNTVKISHLFWLYWVIVVPITLFVLWGWSKWLGGSYRNFLPRRWTRHEDSKVTV